VKLSRLAVTLDSALLPLLHALYINFAPDGTSRMIRSRSRSLAVQNFRASDEYPHRAPRDCDALTQKKRPDAINHLTVHPSAVHRSMMPCTATVKFSKPIGFWTNSFAPRSISCLISASFCDELKTTTGTSFRWYR
jgi:hypothetical protein